METKKAVLCDDDKTTALILRRLLAKIGFSVFIAGDGEEGLALIHAEKPQLLILDLDMPVKNGIAVLEDLQKAPVDDLYTIILSSHEDQQVHDQVQGLGAEEVVVKPFTPADLVKKVKNLIKEGKI